MAPVVVSSGRFPGSANTQQQSFNINPPAGTDRIVLAFITSTDNNTAAGDSCTGVSWGGVAATRVASHSYRDADSTEVTVFALLDSDIPSSLAQLTIDFRETVDDHTLYYVALEDAKQEIPQFFSPTDDGGAGASSISLDHSPQSSDSALVDVTVNSGAVSGFTPTGIGHTKLRDDLFTTGAMGACGYTGSPSTPTHTLGWDSTGTEDAALLLVVEVEGNVSLPVDLTPGIASAEALGALAVEVNNDTELPGIPSHEAVGALSVLAIGPVQEVPLTPGIGSGEVLGSLIVLAPSVAGLFGIASAEALGSLVVIRFGEVLLNGIASAEDLGALAVIRQGALDDAAFPDKPVVEAAFRIRPPRNHTYWATEEPTKLREQLHNFARSTVNALGQQVPRALSVAGKLQQEHAPTHLLDATDPLDGDKLGIDMTFPGLTPDVASEPAIADNTKHLSAILRAIYNLLTEHAPTHLFEGTDPIDGDKLGIDMTLPGVTPDVTSAPGIADNAKHLGAIVRGVVNYIAAHIGDSDNPHQTSIANIVNGTLAQLNGAVTDATLDDVGDPRDPNDHAPTHILNAADEIDGNKLGISYLPQSYVRTNGSTHLSTFHLGSHLKGIDEAIGNHASTHINDGTDEIDGDKLNISFIPYRYGRSLVRANSSQPLSEITQLTDLTAHLAGIDVELERLTTTTADNEHASRHIHGFGDAIAGNLLSITYLSSNYVRVTDFPGHGSVNHLASHLNGIDDELGNLGARVAALESP